MGSCLISKRIVEKKHGPDLGNFLKSKRSEQAGHAWRAEVNKMSFLLTNRIKNNWPRFRHWIDRVANYFKRLGSGTRIENVEKLENVGDFRWKPQKTLTAREAKEDKYTRKPL